MAKRRHFVAELNSATGQTIEMAEAFAWNSAVRASEALVREYARSRETPMTGDTPQVYGGKPASEGADYRRTWTAADGHSVRVRMAEVYS